MQQTYYLNYIYFDYNKKNIQLKLHENIYDIIFSPLLHSATLNRLDFFYRRF